MRTLYDLASNTTTIETWEIERHEQLLRRARAMGGYLDGPDGIRVHIHRQEFPYDIGIWQNICQGMGSNNPLLWLWPFGESIGGDGLSFETNGFEDARRGWPPPDPDRMPRLVRDMAGSSHDGFTFGAGYLHPREEMEAFKRRQLEDFERRFGGEKVVRRKPFRDRFDDDTYQPMDNVDYEVDKDKESLSGEEGWQDSGGNRLKDYGVDEDVEFYDEDDLPLAELMRRRQDKSF